MTGPMKRTPMKPRSQPMQRTSSLKTTNALKRGAVLGGKPAAGKVAQTRPEPVARRRAPRDTGPSPATRKLVLDRDGYRCVCCGRSVIGQRYSLQHRKRRSQGGTNSPSNLVTVLGDGTTGCHARIDSRRDPNDEAKGYTVRSHDDPALIPVMVFSEHGGGVTAWLAEDGGFAFEAPAGTA